MSELLFFLRDGSPASETDVYERGGFQLSVADARARGLVGGATPAEPPAAETKPLAAETKPVRRAARHPRSR